MSDVSDSDMLHDVPIGIVLQNVASYGEGLSSFLWSDKNNY